MHNIDRTMYEADFEDYESEFENYESENYEEKFEAGENEFEDSEYYGEMSDESPFSEAEEMELAAELLGISNEEELDLFLGKLIKKAGRLAGNFIKSPVGGQLVGIIKGAAKSALPMMGGALGNFVLPGVGGAMGSQLASAAGAKLGLELEGLSQEDQEFEVARQIIRFGGAATNGAGNLSSAMPAPQAVRQAAVNAAQQYAPGLLKPNVSQRHKKCGCKRGHGGRWIRHGNRILILGV